MVVERELQRARGQDAATTSAARSSSSASGTWKEKNGGRIHRAAARARLLADWERERFTMDPALSRAVREAFVRLYEEGLIYRARPPHQLVPVVPHRALRSRGRDDEEDAAASCASSPTRSADGPGEIVVATTRPETMLGDTAVAVHPDDARYKHLHGKQRATSRSSARDDPDHRRRDPRRPEVRHRRGEGDARRTTSTTSRPASATGLPRSSILDARRHAERRAPATYRGHGSVRGAQGA